MLGFADITTKQLPSKELNFDLKLDKNRAVARGKAFDPLILPDEAGLSNPM